MASNGRAVSSTTSWRYRSGNSITGRATGRAAGISTSCLTLRSSTASWIRHKRGFGSSEFA
eukprot:8799276-Pyramimonas_sp.AAC.1